MNRLASETSSYLRSAAHQPVHWMPWSEEAFAKARAEDKPILLDVGAVWCHWCHVMDRESYEDPATAEVVNRLFVAVKVDRDERPDVDTRYQKNVQAMTGQGGWPLTAFLLPDGRCFYGGTYFPPVDAHGRPAFKRVLEGVADAYRTRKDEIKRSAEHLDAHLAQRSVGRKAQGAGRLDDEALAAAAAQMRASHDPEHGGFGNVPHGRGRAISSSAPKFPHPAAHDFLLGRDAASRDVATFTLAQMRAGGVYDQLAGGFHRYSVDAEWIVPHFEKMLYDNAGLLRNHVRAGDRATAREIVGFLRDVLRQPDGAFGGSQDADVGPEDDGDFFTWTLDELSAAIDDADLAKLLAAHFGVRAHGDMHHDRAKCVLRVQADAEALAAAFRRPVDEVRARIAEGTRRLRAARAKRPAPFVDPIRYTGWNAMAIQALLEMNEPETDAMALRALDAFLAGAYDPARGFARAIGSTAFGLLDDNAQMLDALVEAHVATGMLGYLSAARATADVVLARFAHPDGAFADRAPSLAPRSDALPMRTLERPVQDAPTGSANGVAIRGLLRLAELVGDARYQKAATDALDALAGEATSLGVFGGALLLAAHGSLHPAPRVVVSASDDAGYRRAARTRVGALVSRPDDPGVPEEARSFPGEGAMVCVGTRCLAPARSPSELVERLREAS